MMKNIIAIILLFTTFSCSSYKIIDKTNCNINKQEIINQLKKQKVKNVELTISYMDKLQDTECCSAFWFKINKWKNFKNIRNKITGLIIKTSKGVYINTYYVGWAIFEYGLREGFDENIVKNHINEVIQLFKEENSCLLDENTISEIEEIFTYGISINYPGIIWQK